MLNGGEVENIMDLVYRHIPKARLSYRESRVLPVVAKDKDNCTPQDVTRQMLRWPLILQLSRFR